eukprot:TRINITY_DN1302_c2_g1_i1.p1 TRINITY_DN1302_c2_g1~~TRINITY_DN1302_c2_g1_i1.p1  ORF type:complete len:505 (+),score=122.66 TRINITY_DN1302_c2_g1_i1:2-1516(+)
MKTTEDVTKNLLDKIIQIIVQSRVCFKDNYKEKKNNDFNIQTCIIDEVTEKFSKLYSNVRNGEEIVNKNLELYICFSLKEKDSFSRNSIFEMWKLSINEYNDNNNNNKEDNNAGNNYNNQLMRHLYIFTRTLPGIQVKTRLNDDPTFEYSTAYTISEEPSTSYNFASNCTEIILPHSYQLLQGSVNIEVSFLDEIPQLKKNKRQTNIPSSVVKDLGSVSDGLVDSLESKMKNSKNDIWYLMSCVNNSSIFNEINNKSVNTFDRKTILDYNKNKSTYSFLDFTTLLEKKNNEYERDDYFHSSLSQLSLSNDDFKSCNDILSSYNYFDEEIEYQQNNNNNSNNGDDDDNNNNVDSSIFYSIPSSNDSSDSSSLFMNSSYIESNVQQSSSPVQIRLNREESDTEFQSCEYNISYSINDLINQINETFHELKLPMLDQGELINALLNSKQHKDKLKADIDEIIIFLYSVCNSPELVYLPNSVTANCNDNEFEKQFEQFEQFSTLISNS